MTEHDGPSPGDQESLAWAEREIKRLRAIADEAWRSLRAGRTAEAEEYLRGMRNG
jgi:hypothetical protein